MELTTTTNQPTSSLIEKYKDEIEALKNWIKFILINKGILCAFFLLLLFILYVVLKKYIKKRTNGLSDIENQNYNDNINNNNNNNEQFNLLNEFQEFQKLVSTVLYLKL